MSSKLRGKVAIVTGAGGYLGAECAQVLAHHGAKVVIVDIDMEAGEKVAAALREKGGEAHAIKADVSVEDEVKEMIGLAVGHYGRLDILYSNAALVDVEQSNGDLDICRMNMEEWDRVIAVNLRGAVLCSKFAVPEMIKSGSGSLIFATSGLGVQGTDSLSAYSLSKAALIHLPRLVATQYGKRGIRANAIQIGLVPSEAVCQKTPPVLLDIQRANHLTPELGNARQIADVVAFLASDESSFVTGSTIVADGGFGVHTPTLAAVRNLIAMRSQNQASPKS